MRDEVLSTPDLGTYLWLAAIVITALLIWGALRRGRKD